MKRDYPGLYSTTTVPTREQVIENRKNVPEAVRRIMWNIKEQDFSDKWDTTLLEELRFDSLHIAELALGLDEGFNISINETDSTSDIGWLVSAVKMAMEKSINIAD